MSEAGALAAQRPGRFGLNAPVLLLAGSILLYVGVAVWTGQTTMLKTAGVVGLLQRMVALGIVAIGQTFAILAGSIDLSVANLISVGAVLASYVMQGRPDMMAPAVALVLVVSAAVGAANGALIARLQVNPLIATLGVGLDPAGPALRELHRFRRLGAEGVPGPGLRRLRPRPLLRHRALRPRGAGVARPAHDAFRRPPLRGRRQRRGRAARGDSHRSGHDRGACRVQPHGRTDRPLPRQPPALRRALDRPRRRLRPRVRSRSSSSAGRCSPADAAACGGRWPASFSSRRSTPPSTCSASRPI